MTSSTDKSEFEKLVCPLSAFDLGKKHIVVTGGGRGLGQGIALSAALAGATVTIISRSTDELNNTVKLCAENGGTCIAYPADLSEVNALDQIVEKIWNTQPIDGVVHAAGVQVRRDSVDVTPEDWAFVQNMNLQAPFFLSARIAKAQIAAGRSGSHVFIGSLNSTIGLPRIAPYAAAKTALLGVARVFSTEWARFGLRANVVAPGYFRTKLTEDLLADETQYARILGRIPAGRLGVPSELGGICIFLLSDASSYVSGQLINVDGGWLAA